MRVATVNLASGRDVAGRLLPVDEMAAAITDLDADVVALQEVDARQRRSGGTDQAAAVARASGADWRHAATLLGTPDPFRSWTPADPPRLRGPGDAVDGPSYGVAVVSRAPVRRWHVLGLASGRARLPVRAPDPRDGRTQTWWFPDEPRVAIAAELDGLTVVGTHLSFAPHTAVRQLVVLRAWCARLPGPVLVAGDLNLPGRVAALVTGGERLVDDPTFPAQRPRLQLDHLVALGGLAAADPDVRHLAVGDHRAVSATVTARPRGRTGRR